MLPLSAASSVAATPSASVASALIPPTVQLLAAVASTAVVPLLLPPDSLPVPSSLFNVASRCAPVVAFSSSVLAVSS